jgi:hypothetical protein
VGSGCLIIPSDSVSIPSPANLTTARANPTTHHLHPLNFATNAPATHRLPLLSPNRHCNTLLWHVGSSIYICSQKRVHNQYACQGGGKASTGTVSWFFTYTSHLQKDDTGSLEQLHPAFGLVEPSEYVAGSRFHLTNDRYNHHYANHHHQNIPYDVPIPWSSITRLGPEPVPSC